MLHRVSVLVGKRRLMLPERGAYARFQRGVYQQTHAHAHQEGHDPLRFLQGERRGQQEQICEKPTATFGMLLASLISGLSCGHHTKGL